MDVYPSRRKIWTAILGFSAFIVIGVIGAAGAATAHKLRREWFVFALLALFVWLLVSAIRELRNPIPLARLDEEGFECALGRVPWANISGVSVRWHWRAKYPSRRVFFNLRNQAQELRPATREYLYRSVFGGPFQGDTEIDLPSWDSQQRMLADVRRYFPAA